MSFQSIGIIGLGKMGSGLAWNALDKGYKVIGTTIGPVPPELIEKGMVAADNLKAITQSLSRPRVIMLSIPAGKVVDEVMEQLAPNLEPGDIILDTGNSYWGDTIRRHQHYRDQGIQFIDCGTSGGTSGAKNGACFMVGGPNDVVTLVEPLLKALAVPGGFAHAGPVGCGHFVKLVHNGIEFGMLQAIAEGMNLLEQFPQQINILETLNTWQNGSVIRSWLIDLMAKAYEDDPGYQKPGHWIEDTGEVNWLVTDALNLDVPIPVIAQSVMSLLKSRDQQFTAERAIIAMRHGFGGHPYGQNAAVASERKTSKVFPFYEFSS